MDEAMREQALTMALGIAIAVMIGVGLVSMLFGQIVELWDRFLGWLGRTAQSEPEHPRSIAIPQVNHVEPDEPAFVNAEEIVLNGEEIEAVARMIKHNAMAKKPSKSSTIQAGFGVARGGSAAYVRASLIYDALFGRPEPAIETPLAGRRTAARFPSDKAVQSAKS